MTANVCNPITKPRNFIIRKVIVICSQIQRLCSTGIKYSTNFYLHNQKTALNGANQCEPGVSTVRIGTECEPLGAYRVSLNDCEPVINVHSDWCEPCENQHMIARAVASFE